MAIFKKFAMSRTWLIVILALLVIIIGIMWVSLQFTGKNRVIKSIEITMKPDSVNYFIHAQDVTNIIVKNTGSPIGRKLSEVNLVRVEGLLRRWSYIQKAQVFATLDGKLKIQITQRIPVMRILNNAGETFFVDSVGRKMPYWPRPGVQPPDVIAANGMITEKFGDSTFVHSKELTELLKVARFIQNSPEWTAQFEQCYVDNFGDIILIPRVGKHSIVIGSSENLPQKMENLRVFYEKGLRNLGWDAYSSISLKFQDQVVATRSGKQTEHKKKTNVQNPEH